MTYPTNVKENQHSCAVFVSGATSGIGEAAARLLADKGFHLIISGRREERLKNLKDELEGKFNIKVHVLCFDVRDRDEVQKAIKSIPTDFPPIQILVNNAGLAWGLDSIQTGDFVKWETMIDTNIKGVLWLTEAIIPLFKLQGSGHIVNMGSIAGKEAYSNGNVYCATKAAVDFLSKGMRMDLAPLNIKVSVIHPGAVETEFSVVRFSGDLERASKVYEGFDPLHAMDIAQAVLFMITAPSHVNVNEMVVMPTAQPSAGIIHRRG